MSTLLYYLAKILRCKNGARDEVIAALGNDEGPNIDNLSKMNYVKACIRESLRINSPTVGGI